LYKRQTSKAAGQGADWLVSSLMDELSIPDGHELIPLFGDGHEGSNREAIATLLNHMVPGFCQEEKSGQLPEPLLEVLRLRLKRRMASALLETHGLGV